jgi:hypothetical protein
LESANDQKEYSKINNLKGKPGLPIQPYDFKYLAFDGRRSDIESDISAYRNDGCAQLEHGIKSVTGTPKNVAHLNNSI